MEELQYSIIYVLIRPEIDERISVITIGER